MKNKTKFESVFVSPDYAVETLINGNVSECVNHLRELIETGITGISEVHDQLNKIKEQVPDRYQYVKSQVFSSKIKVNYNI